MGEAVVGALGVVHSEALPVMATHFAFALLAFSGIAVMTAVIHQMADDPGPTIG